MEILIALIGLSLWMLAGWLVTVVILPVRLPIGWLKRIVYSGINGVFGLGLLVFYANHFLEIRVDERLVWFGLLGLILVSGSWLYLTKARVTPITKPRIDWILVGLLLLGAVWLSEPLFGRGQGVPGPDSPYYIFHAANVINERDFVYFFDRALVFAQPVMVSLVTGFEIETGVKLMVLAWFVIRGLAVYFLINPLLGKKWGWMGVVLSWFNLGTLNSAYNFYAMFIAFTLVNLIVGILLNFDIKKPLYKRKLAMAFWWWGMLFNLHGIVSFGSLVIIGLAIMGLHHSLKFKWRENWKRGLLELFLGLLLMVSSGLPMIGQGWRYVSHGVIEPIIDYVESRVQKQIKPLETLTNTDSGQSPATEINQEIKPKPFGVAQNRVELNQLPLRRHDFLKLYGFAGSLAALMGLVYLITKSPYLNDKMKEKRWVLIGASFGFLLMTQQGIIGFNWFPSRFVNGMFGLIITLSLIAIYVWMEMLRRSGWRQNRLLLAGILVTLVWGIKVNEGIKFVTQGFEFETAIAQDDYLLIDRLSETVGEADLLVVAISNSYWPRGLNPELEIYKAERGTICGETEGVSEKAETIEVALSGRLDEETVVEVFEEKNRGYETLFILVDEENMCVDMNVLSSVRWKLMDQTKRLRLYQLTGIAD